MKNLKMIAHTGGAVTMPLAVPAGTVSGDLVPLGTAGLYGYATTTRVSTEQAAKGTGPQGYIEGQAGVYLPGIVAVVRVSSAALNGIADYAKVYIAPDKTYSGAASGNTWVGYRMGAMSLALRSN